MLIITHHTHRDKTHVVSSYECNKLSEESKRKEETRNYSKFQRSVRFLILRRDTEADPNLKWTGTV